MPATTAWIPTNSRCAALGGPPGPTQHCYPTLPPYGDIAKGKLTYSVAAGCRAKSPLQVTCRIERQHRSNEAKALIRKSQSSLKPPRRRLPIAVEVNFMPRALNRVSGSRMVLEWHILAMCATLWPASDNSTSQTVSSSWKSKVISPARLGVHSLRTAHSPTTHCGSRNDKEQPRNDNFVGEHS
jgi:hypothetical protein